MKEFFSLLHFRELRILLSLESIIILIIWGITSQQGLTVNFCTEAIVASLVCWSIASIVDKDRYFNFFTLVALGTFGYGVFWFMFHVLGPLLSR